MDKYGHIVPCSVLKRMAAPLRHGQGGLVELRFTSESYRIRDVAVGTPKGADSVGGSLNQYSMSRNLRIEESLSVFETYFGRATKYLMAHDRLRQEVYDGFIQASVLQQARMPRYIAECGPDLLDSIVSREAYQFGLSAVAMTNSTGRMFASLNGSNDIRFRPPNTVRKAGDSYVMELPYLEIGEMAYDQNTRIVFYLSTLPEPEQSFVFTSAQVPVLVLVRQFIHEIAEGQNLFIVATRDVQFYCKLLSLMNHEGYMRSAFESEISPKMHSSRYFLQEDGFYAPEPLDDPDLQKIIGGVGSRRNPAAPMTPETFFDHPVRAAEQMKGFFVES